jgi:hypothetical protein
VIKDEFKALEKHVKELEALKRYPRVKQERDSLGIEVTQLKEKVAALESEVSAKNELSSQFSKREAEINELVGKLAETEKELASLRDFKVKLPDSAEFTLDEMRAQFLHAEEDEIKRKVKERLLKLGKNIRGRMPGLVHKRLIKVLNSTEWPPEIAEVIDSKARQIAEGILAEKDRWPGWFESYYLSEVNALLGQQLNTEFEKRVQSEAKKQLELMKAVEWKGYVSSKAMAIASNLKDLLKELQGTWWFTCDRCGQKLSIDLGLSDIGLLLGGGTIDITCTACLDPAPFPFLLSTVRHKVISLTLGRLLELYMGSAPP